jgi:hypothetical protein
MAKQQLIRETINLIQLSTMEPKEKALWMLLLPKMEEAQILKLKASLGKEINAITDLYLKAVNSKK